MMRKMIPLSVAAVAIFLFTGQRASAGSPYDLTAVDDLAAGYDYASSAYDNNPDDWDAYYAYYYAYYAQYYANFAYTYDDQNCWYYACYYAECAAMYAIDSYDANDDEDSNAFYAWMYCSDGSDYAWNAYTY